MKRRTSNSERATPNARGCEAAPSRAPARPAIRAAHHRFALHAARLATVIPALASLADGAPWRTYAVYQPAIERAFVCDAAEQPLRYNHDSSAAWFGDRWFCVWNANTIPEEGAPGQLNYVSTSRDGLIWSAARPAFSDPDLCANPVPCRKGTQWQPNLLVVSNRLWAIWSQASSDDFNGCYLSVLDTPDGKWTNRLLTWSGKADPVIDGKPFRVFPTQNPVRLGSGRVLAPVTLMGPLSAAAPAGKAGWYWLEKRNSVLYTDDEGATWQVSPGAALPQLDWRQWEPTAFEQPDGRVMMFARNNLIPAFENKTLSTTETLTWSLSKDRGATWSPLAYVPLETVVSRMHVLRQEGGDRFLMTHNDWPTGTFGADRRNLALFFNRGGGVAFTAGPGLTDREPEVAYPQMASHGDTLLVSYSQGPCALRSIKTARVSPLPDPNARYLLPRTNQQPAPQCTLTNGELRLCGGLALTCRAAPAVATSFVSAETWINPDDDGVLFDNRSPAGGFVWGLSGACFVHLGDPAKNIRSTLPVRRGRWNRVGLALDYAKGEVTFLVNGERERVTFKPGRRSMSGTSATLFGPNPSTSRLTAFEGAVRSLTLDGTNALFDASTASAVQRDFIVPVAAAACSSSVRVAEVGGRRALRFSGAGSAGVELDANARAQGDGAELRFAFLVGRGDGQVLCTAGDANQPARVVVRNGSVLLAANNEERLCGNVQPGVWHGLALTTAAEVTRVALDGNPPVEVRHRPLATWLYLGEGYRSAEPGAEKTFSIDVGSVRTRVIIRTHERQERE